MVSNQRSATIRARPAPTAAAATPPRIVPRHQHDFTAAQPSYVFLKTIYAHGRAWHDGTFMSRGALHALHHSPPSPGPWQDQPARTASSKRPYQKTRFIFISPNGPGVRYGVRDACQVLDTLCDVCTVHTPLVSFTDKKDSCGTCFILCFVRKHHNSSDRMMLYLFVSAQNVWTTNS